MAEIDARLSDALGAVRDRMTPEERRQWDEDLLRGGAQLESGKVTMTPPSPSEIVPPQLLVAHAVLHGDSDALSDPFVQVLGDGQVRFADTTYDSADPDWAYTHYAWDVTKGRQPSFPTAPAVIEVDDEITLALLGDWGGGNAAPARSQRQRGRSARATGSTSATSTSQAPTTTGGSSPTTRRRTSSTCGRALRSSPSR